MPNLKFVPPKEEASKFPRYATYTAGDMKTHTSIGPAKNSLNNRMWTSRPTGKQIERYGVMRDEHERVTNHAFLLENVDGEYYVLYEIKEGSKFNDLPWVKKFWKHNRYGYTRTTEPTYRADEYTAAYKAMPMSTDEYVAWRLAVERERLGIS